LWKPQKILQNLHPIQICTSCLLKNSMRCLSVRKYISSLARIYGNMMYSIMYIINIVLQFQTQANSFCGYNISWSTIFCRICLFPMPLFTNNVDVIYLIHYLKNIQLHHSSIRSKAGNIYSGGIVNNSLISFFFSYFWPKYSSWTVDIYILVLIAFCLV
jgi:hypothetical protein